MTYFSEVFDYALTTIVDYKLDKLAEQDYQSFLLYLEGILVNAIPDFDGCLKSLDYDYEEIDGERVPYFVSNLDRKEKSILGKLMTIGWFTGKIQDVTQFQNGLNTRDYKKFSEGNNLKEKSRYLDKLRETLEQEITDYQLAHLDELPFFGDL